MRVCVARMWLIYAALCTLRTYLCLFTSTSDNSWNFEFYNSLITDLNPVVQQQVEAYKVTDDDEYVHEEIG